MHNYKELNSKDLRGCKRILFCLSLGEMIMLSRVEGIGNLHNNSNGNGCGAWQCAKRSMHSSFEQCMVDEICKVVNEYEYDQFAITPEIRQVTQSVLQSAGIAAAIEYVKSCT